jgi:hypothetical protein
MLLGDSLAGLRRRRRQVENTNEPDPQSLQSGQAAVSAQTSYQQEEGPAPVVESSSVQLLPSFLAVAFAAVLASVCC